MDTIRALREEVKATKAEAARQRKAAQPSELDQLKAKVEQAEQQLAQVLLRSEIMAVAGRLNFADPTDAVALLDVSKIEVAAQAEDDGSIATADVEAALKELLKSKPHLAKRPAANAPGALPFGPPYGSPTNPGGGATQGETVDQQRQRVYGHSVNVFEPRTAQQHGGGVLVTSAVVDPEAKSGRE